MSFSRRQFLLIAGLALCLVNTSNYAFASGNGKNPLPVPPLLESKSGQPLFLTLQKYIGRLMGNTLRIYGG